MIETDYFILSAQEYQRAKQDSNNIGVNVDYYLMEFCTYEWEWVEVAD
jgi:hypothetical protein